MMKISGEYLISGPVTPAMISTILESLGNNSGTGGHSIFIGQVRADSVGGKRVTAIEYSVYDSMVKAEVDKIIEEVYTSFPDVKLIKIIHSAGVVMAGEISLFILVSAGHRGQAIEACRQIVELIKKNLPVWKKEIFEDNTHEWKNNNHA
jgi:molybdopterin synthase catalytic subunit